MASSSGFGKVAGYQMLLLKDYLRDDLSSCSSSGFKSLPRRQCCPQPPFSSSTKSALHKVSESLVNVFKSLTIIRSPSLSLTQRCEAKKGGGGGGTVVSRSLSLKLLSRSFWKIRQSSSKQQGGSNINNKWTVSHFNCSLTSAKDLTEMEGSVTTTSNYTFSTTTDSTRPNEEKEQFSPVSVLDCPLFDDDEDITSPFSSTTCSNVEGTKRKHVKKGQHFNHVASLKPVALEKRMLSWSIIHEDESLYNHSTKHCPSLLVPIMCKSSNTVSEDKVEENAQDLLNHVKRSIPCNSLRTEAEKLLFDFFKQSIMNNNNDIENSTKHEYLCKVAENWIRGQPQEQNRQCLSWRICEEEVQNLIMELEVDFSSSLVNELVHDLIT